MIYVASTFTALSSGLESNWQPTLLIGSIAGVSGSVAILYFFRSNRRDIEKFVKNPSMKIALIILAFRRLKSDRERRDA